MTPSILALDLASKTGWAHSCGESGVHDFGFTPDERHGAQMIQFANWLGEFETPTCVVCEQPHHRGGASTLRAIGMLSTADKWAAELGACFFTVHTGTLKKHATGHGHASKPKMVAAARRRWPEAEIIDDNHSDALWLLDYALVIARNQPSPNHGRR